MYNKIGVLGGSFNPIHDGHLMLGIAAHEQFQINRILVMPNRDAYYKNDRDFVPEKARTEMVKLAIKPYPYMEFSDLELKRNKPTYTCDTIRILKKIYPDTEIYFIIGGDSLETLAQWYRIEDLMACTHFLAAGRDGVIADRLRFLISDYRSRYSSCHIDLLQTEGMDISSSEIRKKLQMGDTTVEHLPKEVMQYIRNHHLYES